MISISHWGMFPLPLWFVPRGFRLPTETEVYDEMSRPDGMIELLPIEQKKANRAYLRGWLEKLA